MVTPKGTRTVVRRSSGTRGTSTRWFRRTSYTGISEQRRIHKGNASSTPGAMCKPGASPCIPVGSRIDRARANTRAKDPYIEATIVRCLPLVKEEGGRGGSSGAQADMPLAEASGAICVQTFDDSRNSAIHTTYRISLRSSSLREPRYPLLRVV
jgi:hypothetical protein